MVALVRSLYETHQPGKERVEWSILQQSRSETGGEIVAGGGDSVAADMEAPGTNAGHLALA